MKPFEVGERVRLYGRGPEKVEVVVISNAYPDGWLRVALKEGVYTNVHPKQCRRLKPKAKPREWWLFTTGDNPEGSYCISTSPPLEPEKWIHVREVKKK